MTELIDTTEMYLKTVYELEEDGVPPLRARIVERLDHSGPTVSRRWRAWSVTASSRSPMTAPSSSLMRGADAPPT